MTYLKDFVLSMVQQDPTADLMPDTLAALSALCLAQAQEAIYLKAARGKRNLFLLLYFTMRFLFRSNESRYCGENRGASGRTVR